MQHKVKGQQGTHKLWRVPRFFHIPCKQEDVLQEGAVQGVHAGALGTTPHHLGLMGGCLELFIGGHLQALSLVRGSSFSGEQKKLCSWAGGEGFNTPHTPPLGLLVSGINHIFCIPVELGKSRYYKARVQKFDRDIFF